MIAALLGTAILGAGMEYRDGDGSTLAAQHFVYPNTGFAYQSEQVYLEANSPLPVVLPDGIAAAIVFLAGGDGIPLWTGLNGRREPVGFRFMDGTARWSLPFADVAALEVGATAGLSIGSVFVGEERISVFPASIGPSVGFRTGSPETVVMRFALQAGNAWTQRARGNPWAGANVRSTMALTQAVFLELRGDWTRYLIDLSTYRTTAGDRIAGKETLNVWGGEVRIGFRL